MVNRSVGRRPLLKALFKLGVGASFLRPITLWSSTSDDQFLEFVHPELRDIARPLLSGGMVIPPLSQNILEQSRKGLLAIRRPPSAATDIEKRLVAGANGQPDVEIYIVNAKAKSVSEEPRPAILHMHGGGFVMGSAKDSLVDLQELSVELDCVIVSVEYRLAPETIYVGSVEDNYSALKWLYENADAIGVDKSRIAVMGESAGGAHAALLAITARDRGEVPIAFQCLIYPMLDDRTGSSRAVPPHIGKIIWTDKSNQFGWSSFLGVPAGGDKVPTQAVPARTKDLTGLPPCFIGVGSLDLFSDECIEYAQRLNNAGVSTELLVIPGAFHGFDALGAFGSDTAISQRFTNAKYSALRQGLNI